MIYNDFDFCVENIVWAMLTLKFASSYGPAER